VMVPSPTVDATPGVPLPMSALFNVTDVDNGPLAYLFFDKSAGGGHFEVNGVVQAANHIVGVATADLANTTFVAGQTARTTFWSARPISFRSAGGRTCTSCNPAQCRADRRLGGSRRAPARHRRRVRRMQRAALHPRQKKGGG
jgi:hypothetical protein